MFYARINKIKVFDNREGFLGLFNKRAELKIYSYVKAPLSTVEKQSSPAPLSISDLVDLPDEAARKQKLLAR